MSEEVTPNEPVEPAKGEPVEKDEPLGEPGLKALKAEREKAAAAVKQAQEFEAKLREYEDRDKSAEQKAQERLAEAEKRAVEVELRATRAEVAADTAVPTDFLAGPKSGSADDLKVFAEALIAWRGDAPQSRGPVIPGQGTQPALAPDSKAAAFGRALGLND